MVHLINSLSDASGNEHFHFQQQQQTQALQGAKLLKVSPHKFKPHRFET